MLAVHHSMQYFLDQDLPLRACRRRAACYSYSSPNAWQACTHAPPAPMRIQRLDPTLFRRSRRYPPTTSHTYRGYICVKPHTSLLNPDDCLPCCCLPSSAHLEPSACHRVSLRPLNLPCPRLRHLRRHHYRPSASHVIVPQCALSPYSQMTCTGSSTLHRPRAPVHTRPTRSLPSATPSARPQCHGPPYYSTKARLCFSAGVPARV